ncbi:MAG: TonB-dependent receptor [Cellvibrionaceae bacterium]|nr:TonB-dependent receptor [Cellvibrionaceae bacterium]
MKTNFSKNLLALAMATSAAYAQAEDAAPANDTIEEVTVIGKSVSYANNSASSEMIKQQSAMTSPLAVIDNLPGVLVNEGDTFGTDDWSTTVSIRGFQLSLDSQQVGVTVDGIANGNSNYGGGAKANRYIDTENLQTVEVSQGTADVASRSNEALGGTLNFTTIDPGEEERLTLSVTAGDADASKYFVRYETGEILPETYAWLSVSSSENADWIDGSAENTRDHFAGKLISTINDINITAYVSYDDVHEDNYQRVSLAQFEQDPSWDRLTGEWTGTPYVDQLYRKGWSTLRENLFGYLKAEFELGQVEVNTNIYYHKNEGRGDWVPPYMVDVTDDGANGHSELQGNTVMGGAPLGRIFFVDANGNSLSPNAGCQSSITFPYGGAGPEYDPKCYGAGAIAVGSYRHTHYAKERKGFNADFVWETSFGDVDNTLRGGIWYEDYHREEYRDWHKIIDSSVGYNFDHQAYWVQYSVAFPVDTMMMYLEDQIEVGPLTARVGLKRFDVELEKQDKFSGQGLSVDSDSDTLLSAGVVVRTPVEGLEVFAGYAENFAAIKDGVLERDASALANIEPETADNIDLGLRYEGDSISASLTYYSIEFENRLTFLAPDSPDGIDYLIGTNGSYINTGGIESKGLEASLTVAVNDNWSVYASYTDNDSEYADRSPGFPTGNTVFGSAERMGVLSIDWQKDSYSAGLSTKWVGERWLDAANTQRIDAYTVADFYAAVSLGAIGEQVEDVQLRLTINNITDESYLGGVAGSGAWIGAPRTAAVNLQASF